MQLEWRIELADIRRVKRVVADHAATPIVRARHARNLSMVKPAITRSIAWRAIAGGLLASRQRSGLLHPVTRFLCARPFPLDFQRFAALDDPHPILRQTLRDCGGLGRSRGVVDQLADNLDWLRHGGWDELESRFDSLELRRAPHSERPHSERPHSERPHSEREVADWIDRTLYGFGPRESRRMLLMLGLTRLELPLDARLTRWLNRLPVMPRLSASSLADRSYYRLVLDGVQQLCAASDTLPCILDASVLAASGLPGDDATCW